MLGHGENMIDFEKNSYTVVKGLVEPEWCKTLYNYVGYSADRCGLKQKHDEEKYREAWDGTCLLYTSPSPRDATLSRMPSSA